MNFFELFKNTLNEEKKIPGKEYAIVCDIDDCLVQANPDVIKMYRKLPTDKQEVELTTAEFAKENVTPENKKYYSYRDFDNPEKVYKSIVTGRPIVQNLRALDDFVNNGADVYFLTARGLEDIVHKALNAFIKIRRGNLLHDYKIPRDHVFAINDKKGYPGATDAEKKKNVFRELASKYDYVYMIDDDAKNLARIKDLKKESPELNKKVRTINAKKNMEVGKVEEGVKILSKKAKYGLDADFNAELLARFNDKCKKAKELQEDTLTEMAMKDVTSDMLSDIKAKKYGDALKKYFDVVKNQESYKNLADVASAFKKMLTYGIARTFGAFEKKGDIELGATAELKKYGIDHLKDIIADIEYENNPEYVAPKRAASSVERKKVSASTIDGLKSAIASYKNAGWKCNDETPKEGNTKILGQHFYVYMTKPKASTVAEEYIIEMALKDVDEGMVKDVENKRYADALKKYFLKIKDTGTYASKDSNEAAFNHMLNYGVLRTFNALETKGKIPEGSAKALKEYGINHKNEILSGIEEKAKPEVAKEPEEKEVDKQPEEEKKVAPKKIAKGEYPKYEDSESGSLKKIADRVAKYSDLKKELEDYAFSSKVLAPFVVDVKKNGDSGTSLGVEKPKLTGLDSDNPLLSKTERYIAPMLKFREQFIPDFIKTDVDKGLEGKGSDYVSGEDVRNIQKAETLGQEYVEATKNKIYALAMVKFLNNIVMGLNDFNVELKKEGKSFTDKEILDRLKNDVLDFPYRDFVRLDKWSKNIRMAADKAKAEGKEKVSSKAAISDEIYKVRKEYIAFLNALEKAQANDEISDFVTNQLATIRAALETPIDRDSKQPVSKSLEKELKPMAKEAGDTAKELVPTLKDRYASRADENSDDNATANYKALDDKLFRLIMERNALLKNPERKDDLDKVEVKIAKAAEEVTDVFLDRLAALDIIMKTAGSGILGSTEETVKRYNEIKKKYAKMLPATKKGANVYDPNSDKYKQYYDPEGEEKEKAETSDTMYKELDDGLMKNFNKMAENKLQPTLLNIRFKKYSDEELKKLYDAYKKDGIDALIELLKTPELKAKRD